MVALRLCRCRLLVLALLGLPGISAWAETPQADLNSTAGPSAVLREARSRAAGQLNIIPRATRRIRRVKITRKRPASGVYPAITPLVRDSAVRGAAAALRDDPRYKALDPQILQPLEQEWGQIDSVRTELLGSAYKWDGENDQLLIDGDKIDRDGEEIERRRSSLNAEIDDFNRQCTGRELPPDQYKTCAAWRDRLIERNDQLNADIDSHNARVDEWNSRNDDIFERGRALVGSIQAWENRIQSWIDAAKKAMENSCRPLTRIDVDPPMGQVATGGLTVGYDARPFFGSQPAGAPPCPVDLFWTLQAYPDTPGGFIGSIFPRSGRVTTFTSGKAAGTGTITVQDLVSGIGTTANVSVYNPAQ